MRFHTLMLLWLTAAISALAQPAAGYYDASKLDGKHGRDLELALGAIVYPHTRISYDDLWEKFAVTDVLPADLLVDPEKTDQVYDMYASWERFPKYYTAHNGETSADLHSQTGGFNREHSVPNSWWGGKNGNSEAYSDLHHLTPADGAANNAKSDWPLGEYFDGATMGWPTKTATNGSGYTYMEADNTPDHSGSWSHTWLTGSEADNYGGAARIWEPDDQFKGDFARMYFYVVCAYEGKLTWQTTYMFTSDASQQTTIKPWALDLLLRWHRQDPVSQKERDRNNAVCQVQSNRNPFIDYPELVEFIWGDKSTDGSFCLADAVSSYSDDYNNPPIVDPDPQPAPETHIYFPHIARVGQEFTAPAIHTNSDGALTYSSSNPDVADVDAATGAVTIKAVGTAIITATQAETEEFTPAAASYMIQVVE